MCDLARSRVTPAPAEYIYSNALYPPISLPHPCPLLHLPPCFQPPNTCNRCAVHGLLKQQKSRAIVFAWPPGQMSINKNQGAARHPTISCHPAISRHPTRSPAPIAISSAIRRSHLLPQPPRPFPPGVFGQCKGLKTSKCHMPYEGFANDDIYYLEVCLFSQVPCQKPHA